MATALVAGDVRMPRLSDSMEEGTIVKWLVGDGEQVASGQDLVEVETDKATVTYEAEAEGQLTILAEAGATVAVGHPIARIENASSPRPEPQKPVGSGGAGRAGRAKATPVARRVATEHDLALDGVAGSGPNGRIVKTDVEALIRQLATDRSPSAAAAPASAERSATSASDSGAPPVPAADVVVEELSRVQRTIARRMAESKSTVPDFAVSIDVDMEAAATLRAQLKQAASDGQSAPSFNDLVVKAAALALREFPRANGSYRDGHFELHERVNVGVAVAADDALLVPTVVDADRASLGEIARTTRALAAKARAGTLAPAELSGGTFTVSNLGMYGVTSFQAIVNPPQAAILAVAAIEERATVHESRVVARRALTMTLTADHRILFGADAALFLARVRDLLETPLALVL